uniref:Uncharacterized protein n=1 Tax=Coccolithus braarudii TaxID=221442 RepID=A0A7S0LBB5_9EUKA|mmetsp:Transcript_31141/g.66872  ORF Transcript_31141/g.66872 Transcript_31141/m.66872 type:complete len:110 (+) Transcript_31141:93-422(+)
MSVVVCPITPLDRACTYTHMAPPNYDSPLLHRGTTIAPAAIALLNRHCFQGLSATRELCTTMQTSEMDVATLAYDLDDGAESISLAFAQQLYLSDTTGRAEVPYSAGPP